MNWYESLFGKSTPKAARSRPTVQRTMIDAKLDELHRQHAPESASVQIPGQVRLGYATGRLKERGHIAVPRAGTPIDLSMDVMVGGTDVVGPMGSGKTRAVLQGFARDFMRDPRAGLFAYGVKRNWSRILVQIARDAGRTTEQIHVVGPGNMPWPLLRGLPPESVATFARAAFELGSKHGGGDQFFKDSATNLLRYASQILYAASAGDIPDPLHLDVYDIKKVAKGQIPPPPTVTRTYDLGYTLQGIAEIAHSVKDPAMWTALVIAATDRASDLTAAGDDDAAEMLTLAIEGLKRTIVGKAAGETTDSIVMQIDTVIEPFISSGPLRRTFCWNADGGLDLAGSLSAGHAVIVDVDLAQYDAAARLVYLLAFEQLRVFMLARIGGSYSAMNPVVFIADEYAEVVSREHRKMWRVCREANIAPVVAYQLQSDLQATLGSRDEADAMVAGFATKVVFRTDDSASIRLVGDALGKAEVERTSSTTQRGLNSSASSGGGSNASSGMSEGSSSQTNMQERSVIDAQLMQSLTSRIRREVPVADQTAEVLVVTSLGERRIADIVTVHAWDPPIPESDL